MNLHERKYFIGMDLLRFIAAFAVMTFHLVYWVWKADIYLPVASDLRSFESVARFGWVGVEIFFLISGFVITLSASAASPEKFFRNRLLRLAPAAWICGTITAIALLLDGEPFSFVIKAYCKTLIFWPLGGWVDYSYWTLGVEISFYLLIFIIILIVRFDFVETIVGTIGIASSLFWLLTLLTENTYLLQQASFTARASQLFIQYNTFFALGVLLYNLFTKGVSVFRVATMLVCLFASCIEIYYHHMEMLDFGVDPSIRKPISIISAGPAMAAFLISIALVSLSIYFNDFLSTHFGHRYRVIRRVGLMTYPLYLIHQRLGYIVIEHLHPHIGTWKSLAAAFSSCIVLAFLISLYAEPPLRRLLAAILDCSTRKLRPSHQL